MTFSGGFVAPALGADPVVKVVIHVADSNGTRIAGQTIYITKKDGGFYDIASAVTDDAGNATINEALAPGVWLVEHHQGFGGTWSDAHATFEIGPGRTSYQISLPLAHSGGRVANTPPTPPGSRELAIRVQGRDKNGQVVPVHYAAIYDSRGREIVMTDINGKAVVRHDLPLGEMYELKAEANHWKTGTSSFTVGAAEGGSRLTLQNDYVNFMLSPSVASGAPLTVEVLDRKTDKPIRGASITLYKPNKFPGTAIATKSGDAKGEATFDGDQISEAQLNGNARVGAKASGYDNAVQDVTAELFSQADANTGGEARYVVYLKKKAYNGAFDMSGQWHFNWTWSVTSVDFTGTMSQSGPTSFAFDGKVSGGGNAIWTAREGSVTCELSGKPNAQIPPAPAAKLTCSAVFPGPNGNWSGSTDGAVSAVLYAKGKKKIEYRGRGKGTGGDGKPAGIDSFSIQPK